ncbi:porin, partial [Brucella lupini]|uniref:porin n=1 Tax=Brucella lupini TaxID=255457 RepID=UPI00178C429B
GAYKSNDDEYFATSDGNGGFYTYRGITSFYGTWGGDWAVWGGLKYKASEKAVINVQAAYEDWGKTAVTANVAYQLVPGFT